MTVHFLHIGKTGGTAIKSALGDAGLAFTKPENAHKFPETPYGRIQVHNHRFRFDDVPPGDHVIFFLRDPISRMVSGFHSRLNKGQPRYLSEWTPDEQRAFEAFPTVQRLADALASDDEAERSLAGWAMKRIRHLGPMERFTGPPDGIDTRLDQVLHIGRQETLDADWRQIKRLLRLPADLELPTDPVAAHRGTRRDDPELDDRAVAALRDWYARDYLLLEFCEGLRAKRGWGRPDSRLHNLRRRLPVGRLRRR